LKTVALCYMGQTRTFSNCVSSHVKYILNSGVKVDIYANLSKNAGSQDFFQRKKKKGTDYSLNSRKFEDSLHGSCLDYDKINIRKIVYEDFEFNDGNMHKNFKSMVIYVYRWQNLVKILLDGGIVYDYVIFIRPDIKIGTNVIDKIELFPEIEFASYSRSVTRWIGGYTSDRCFIVKGESLNKFNNIHERLIEVINNKKISLDFLQGEHLFSLLLRDLKIDKKLSASCFQINEKIIYPSRIFILGELFYLLRVLVTSISYPVNGNSDLVKKVILRSDSINYLSKIKNYIKIVVTLFSHQHFEDLITWIRYRVIKF